ncbi:MAG: hypothetical protein ACTHL8_23315 [Burkholderiaceae bacterium]
MSAQLIPFGLQPVSLDYLTAPGDAGPLLRAVAASDANAYAVGDLVRETGDAIAGTPIVVSALRQTDDGGAPLQPAGARGTSLAALCVVVAVAPATPGDHGPQPTLAAGAKGSTSMVWVVRAGSREFFIIGDASTPAWGDWQPVGAQMPSLHDQGIEAGGLFADLTYGAPSAGASGTALAGASFTTSPRADVAVRGFGGGSTLGPHAMYRVTLAAPVAFIAAPPLQRVSDGM